MLIPVARFHIHFTKSQPQHSQSLYPMVQFRNLGNLCGDLQTPTKVDLLAEIISPPVCVVLGCMSSLSGLYRFVVTTNKPTDDDVKEEQSTMR